MNMFRFSMLLLAVLVVGVSTSIATATNQINPAPELVNGWHPAFSNDILSNDGFWHVWAMKIFASGNFPTTSAQLASGEENPLGSVWAGFGTGGRPNGF